MKAATTLLCPFCGGGLTQVDAARLTCGTGNEIFPLVHGVYDLRRHPDVSAPPQPLRTEDFAPVLSAQERGEPYKAALEQLLLSLDDIRAERMMQILGEGRGAWFPLLSCGSSSDPGQVLFVGNALSGTIPALARAGWHVTVLDPSPERARYGHYRNETNLAGCTRTLVGGDSPVLPFADASFDAVVQESGFPRAIPAFAHDLSECRRVCLREIVLIGNNRLGYKRSTGRRSIFRTPGPLEFTLGALRPAEGERTLAGWRRVLAGPGFAESRAFALYPHASDFTHVVALDARRPSLTIGPKERRNRLKLAARSLGLFPVLAPSYLLLSTREEFASAPLRVERMLAAVAERVGEPAPEVEHLVSTRGQASLIHTRARGESDPNEQSGGAKGGRWTLHIPFSPRNSARVARRHEALSSVRRRFPSVPVPEPLFHGRADGVLLSCERRLAGRSAPQISGDRGRVARMLEDVSSHFARLIVRPAARLTEQDFDELIVPRFDIAARHAAVGTTIETLKRKCDEAREQMVGRSMPRVFHHSDLRAKHVQVREDGSVIGYLDWSASEDEFLPYQDLLNLVVHERKQEAGIPISRAWRLVCDRRDLRNYERKALDGYCRAVGIDDEIARAIEAIYPVLIAAMAEQNWEYSRPRWLHRQFDV